MPDDRTSTGSGVSRRRFLQTLGVSAAAAPLARSADAQQRGRTGTDGVAILGPGPVNISLRINGKPYQATIDPAATLLDALRIDLNLTGTKEICDRGACGGCSVLVDGKLTASCMMLAVDAIGSEITTVEGLASVRLLHAGHDHGGQGASEREPPAHATGDQARARRQPLPVRHLHQCGKRRARRVRASAHPRRGRWLR
jgi:hypothetical protein